MAHTEATDRAANRDTNSASRETGGELYPLQAVPVLQEIAAAAEKLDALAERFRDMVPTLDELPVFAPDTFEDLEALAAALTNAVALTPLAPFAPYARPLADAARHVLANYRPDPRPALARNGLARHPLPVRDTLRLVGRSDRNNALVRLVLRHLSRTQAAVVLDALDGDPAALEWCSDPANRPVVAAAYARVLSLRAAAVLLAVRVRFALALALLQSVALREPLADSEPAHWRATPTEALPSIRRTGPPVALTAPRREAKPTHTAPRSYTTNRPPG